MTCADLVLASRRFVGLTSFLVKLLAYQRLNFKGITRGSVRSAHDLSPVPVDGGMIEIVQQLTYLVSKLPCDREILKLANVLLGLLKPLVV